MLTRIRRILTTILLALLLAPAAANGGWQEHRVRQMADVMFQHPCQSAWPIHRLFIDNPGKPPLLGFADPRDCQHGIYLTAERLPWPKFCTVTLSLAGVLKGLPDSSNPRSIMHPRPTRPDPRCAKRGRPYLKRHGMLATATRFVLIKEWKAEARREARRECLRIQRDFKEKYGFDFRECIGDSHHSGPCLRSLQGDVAFCRAEFEIEYKEIGKTRVYVAYVHMHVGPNNKIAVERPVGWRSHWLGGEPT